MNGYLRLLLCGLLCGAVLHGRAVEPLFISEIMAANSKTLADEDGEFSDWIEIYNAGTDAVNLQNWFLTDRANDLTQWRFPATNLGPRQLLLVFASGKNRRVPGAPLHTNFRLSASGEYLALVAPDGQSIAHQFAPQFPALGTDVSYGLAASGATTLLVPTGNVVRAFVPRDGSLGTDWTSRSFEDSNWLSGHTGVGYERHSGYESFIGLDLLAPSFPAGQRIDVNGDGINENSSVYIRVPFVVADPAALNSLALRMRYADGFVAYLNGQVVARENEPPEWGWDSSAASDYGAIADLMIAIVYGPGNSIALYRNGEVYAPAATATTGTLRTYPANVAEVLIGKRNADLAEGGGTRLGKDGYLAGSVNEARVYGAPLSAADVKTLFQLGPVGGTNPLPAAASAHLLHQWTFNDGTASDALGAAPGTLRGGATIQDGRLVLDGIANYMQSAPLKTHVGVRTLVVWLSLDNLTQQGGGALTIQDPTATDVYDSIVFGERRPQQWMNGSSLYARSVRDNGGAPETATETVVTGPEAFDLSQHVDKLVAGTNLLAIHGLNHSLTDPNFLILPELRGGGFDLDPSSSGYYDQPTPGQVNAPKFQRVFANLTFSHERGIYSTPFTLSITSDTPDIAIRYTLDGRAPNLTDSLIYSQPIEVSRTRTIRAAAFRAGLAPSEPVTHTFVFVTDILRQTNSAPAGAHWDTAMDPQIVNDRAQTWSVAEGLVDLPMVSIVMAPADLFGPKGIYLNPTMRGDEWERSASVEFFYPDEYQGHRAGQGFAINCGIQINGNFSRLTHQPKHSFRLVFKERWGPSKLEFPVFADSPVTSFDTLLVACGHNQGWSTGIANTTFLRNRMCWELEGVEPGRAHVHSRSVHVYLNGLYWGIYDLGERPDETFSAAHFGGDKAEYDVLKGLPAGGSFNARLINGMRDAWKQLFALTNANFKNPENFAKVLQLVDMDQFIDYSIGILYTADRDGPTGWLNGWPNNSEPKNFYATRRRVPDGRFRFWRWDSEFTFESPTEDVSERRGAENPGQLHYVLRASPEYRRRFADRVQQLFFNHGPYTTTALSNRYLRLSMEIDKAVVAESARWGDAKREPPFRRDVEWIAERDRILKRYLPERFNAFFSQLRADGLYPAFPPPVAQIDGTPQPGGEIAAGSLLSLTATSGRIYFTLDGTDPRGTGEGTPIPLVTETSPARALVPVNGTVGTTWRTPTFDDSAWLSGANAVGYDRGPDYRPLLGLDLLGAGVPSSRRIDVNGDGTNENNTVFTRFAFSLPDPSILDGLTLKMRYDDGFVAFLNGAEVARSNAPTTLDWNSTAPAFRGDGGEVMMAIAYGADSSITIYRNGEVYAASATTTQGTVATYSAGVADVLIGKRHDDLSAGGSPTGVDGFLAGSVNEARLYRRALNAAEIAHLFALGPVADAQAASGAAASDLVHQWTFNDGTARDLVGAAHGTLVNGASASAGRLLLDGVDDYMRSAPIGTTLQARTLVVWVSLDNLTQRGGSALTIETPTGNDDFDGIVLGERVARQWMNGSPGFLRSVADNRGAPETWVTSGVLAYQTFDLSAHLGKLKPGANVLAIQGLNSGSARRNMLVMPVLEAAKLNVPSNAVLYTGPIALADSTIVKSRVLVGTQWSALDTATFYTPQDPRQLVLTELMYHPPDLGGTPDTQPEFLELKNAGPQTLVLDGMEFTAGISFRFPAGTLLAPGAFFLLAGDADRFAQRYPGRRVDGVYTGQLDDGGETLRLEHPQRGIVFEATYGDAAPWPVTPDGYGFSLVLRAPQANPAWNSAVFWRASAFPGGSPGADDPEPAIPPVLVNEILSASPSGSSDRIELFNPTPDTASVGGWFLTDDKARPRKFRIPDGTPIASGAYLVFTESDFNPALATTNNFQLSAQGEEVYLFSADADGNLTGYDHGWQFGAASPAVSFGRHLISTGEAQFPPQRSRTFGATNSGPRIGPLVITEIHYHPPPTAEAAEDEFIELKNLTDQPVPLFDPLHPTSTWRISGLNYLFPPATTLGANAILIVAQGDPERFRTRHAVPADVIVLGPAPGRLNNAGERLLLQRPEWLDPDAVSWVTVDEVDYDNRVPWPEFADGNGPALQRRSPELYGNDPVHWLAARPSPGVDPPGGDPPQITGHPQPVTAVAYLSASFTVAADGTAPLSYQWQFKGQPIPGATSPTLSLPDLQPSAAGPYRAVVYNAAGVVLSSDALLEVRIPATIVQQPQNRVVTSGGTATFTVIASGQGTLRYQWRFNGADLAGKRSATLTLSNVQADQAGAYQVIVTDDVGSAPSRPATLIVLVKPAIVVQPESREVVQGQNASFDVTVSGTPPFTYRWRRNGVNVSSPTLDSPTCILVVTNAQPAQGGAYSVSVTNAAGASPTSADAILTVLADNDRDGMADRWETTYGLSPDSVLDAAQDADGDTMPNLDEFLAGTNPIDPSSYLRFDPIVAGPQVLLSFQAVSNRLYRIEFNDALGAGAWQPLTNWGSRPTNDRPVLPVPATQPLRYYRLLTSPR